MNKEISTWQDLLQEAQDRYDTGKMVQSQTLAEKALRRDPGNPRILLLLGRISLSNGEIAKGQDMLLKAADADRTSAVGHMATGLIVLNASQNADAYVSFKKAVELEPDTAPAWKLLRDACIQLKQRREAQGCTDQIERIRKNLISRSVRKAKSDAAFALKSSGNTGKPISVQELLRTAGGHLSQGRVEQAKELYQCAVDSQPDSALALQGLGVTLVALGRHDEAISPLKKAVVQMSGLVDALYNLVEALIHQKRFGEAELYVRKLIAKEPMKPRAHLSLGTIFYNQGKYAEAEVSFKRCLELDPTSAESYAGLGLIAEYNNQVPEAIDHYQRALALQRNHPIALANLGKLQRLKFDSREQPTE